MGNIQFLIVAFFKTFVAFAAAIVITIDDEIHLLLHCCAMMNEREILYDSVAAIINIQPTNEMFLGIMTSRDITVLKSLAQFIYGCFKQIKG